MTQTFFGNQKLVDGASTATRSSRLELITAQRAIDA